LRKLYILHLRLKPANFVVVSAEDWEREQETLYVLQNKSLMEQIERSLKTHGEGRPHLYTSLPADLSAGAPKGQKA